MDSSTDLDYEDDIVSDPESMWSGTTLTDSAPDSGEDEPAVLNDTRIVEINDSSRNDTAGEDERIVILEGQRIGACNIHPEDCGAEMVVVDWSEGQVCRYCHVSVRFIRLHRHVVGAHLPWYVQGYTACHRCGEQCLTTQNLRRRHPSCLEDWTEQVLLWADRMQTILQIVADALGLPSLEALRCFVIQRRLYPHRANGPYNSEFTVEEQRWLQKFDVTNNFNYRETRYTPSPPNRVVCLVHWRIFANLMTLLSDEVRVRLYRMPMFL